MAERPSLGLLRALRPTLESWVYGTVDLVVLVLGVVLVGYWTGGLGPALAEANTLVGVGVFAALWALITLAVAGLAPPAGFADATFGDVALRAVAAGGAVGAAFVGLPGLVAVPFVVAAGGSGGATLLVVTIAVGIAAVVGSVVGLLAGLLDATLARTGDAVLAAAGVQPAETRPGDRSDEGETGQGSDDEAATRDPR